MSGPRPDLIRKIRKRRCGSQAAPFLQTASDRRKYLQERFTGKGKCSKIKEIGFETKKI